MVMEAISIKLKQLRARLADLALARAQVEQSDGRAYSNGRIADIDKDIAYARGEVANWYKQHQFTTSNGPIRLTISKLEHGFEVILADLSKPGVMKKIEGQFTDADAGDLVDYLGGRTIFLGMNYIDAEQAATVLKKDNDRLRAELASQVRLHQDAMKQMDELRGECSALESSLLDAPDFH
jgi:hypothetical protein